MERWLRLFFEDVCDYTHEKEFVYLTSQNSMAALIDGLTFHSYMKIPFMKEDGVQVNRRAEQGEHGISDLCLQFGRLRWIFIDECSTMGAEVLAAGDDKARRHVRGEHTGALRSYLDTGCCGNMDP